MNWHGTEAPESIRQRCDQRFAHKPLCICRGLLAGLKANDRFPPDRPLWADRPGLAPKIVDFAALRDRGFDRGFEAGILHERRRREEEDRARADDRCSICRGRRDQHILRPTDKGMCLFEVVE